MAPLARIAVWLLIPLAAALPIKSSQAWTHGKAQAASPFVINLIWQSTALAAPQSFRDAMQAAANAISAVILDTATINIQVGYGSVVLNGSTINLPDQRDSIGGSLNSDFISYPSIRSALAAKTTTSTLTSFVAALPNTSSIDGHSNFTIQSAVGKVLGFHSPTDTADDGYILIGTSITSDVLVGVGIHEITHALGREIEGTFTLGRFTSSGTRNYNSVVPASASYFSIDNGVTKMADYGINSDISDTLNGGVQDNNGAPGLPAGLIDAYDEFYAGLGTPYQGMTNYDVHQLNCMGFKTTF